MEKKLMVQNKILEEQRRYYQELYQEDEDIDFTETNNSDVALTDD